MWSSRFKTVRAERDAEGAAAASQVSPFLLLSTGCHVLARNGELVVAQTSSFSLAPNLIFPFSVLLRFLYFFCNFP